MDTKEKSALCSSELMKLPHDPSDVKDDIWQFMIQVRSLKEQLEEFEVECQRKFVEQMCTLDGLMHWCDSLLYRSCKLYSKRSSMEKDTPEDR